MIADDEPNLRRVLSVILLRDGYTVRTAANGLEALQAVEKEQPDVVITDLKMPKLSGMQLLRKLKDRDETLPVIMITAFGSVGEAVEAVKAGAFDYLEKPFEQEQIRQVVRKAVNQSIAAQSQPRAKGASQESGRFGLVGGSEPMRKVYDVIDTVADSPSTVLITGESGTGKELVARALHENSSRADQAFIRINCAAIPKNLMESELFGYEKGAFTGATASKPGRFELADGGTLFLDEIAEIPVEMQVKLLRALQESEFERVGGIKTLQVNVRLITATNRDLEEETKNGNFREDLFYRLNVVPLRLAPLRERPGDIPLLTKHIIEKFNSRLSKEIKGISKEGLAKLTEYHWPGNIRELENVLERTILFANGETIQLEDLPEELGQVGDKPEKSITDSGQFSAESLADSSLKEIVREQTSKVEKELIVKALDETSGNVTQAAKLLKISRKSLQMKMKDFGLRNDN